MKKTKISLRELATAIAGIFFVLYSFIIVYDNRKGEPFDAEVGYHALSSLMLVVLLKE